MREDKEEEKKKLELVLAAKSRSLCYTTCPASPRVFASPIHTLASVPFCWEDQPGKPKNPLLPFSYPKCLDLPPRLLLPGEFTQMPCPERKHGLFGFLRKRGRGEVFVRGNYVFLPENQRATEINSNMKIMRFDRSGSLQNGGSVKGTHFWASLCKVLKLAMPWKNKKLRRRESI
ncbi:hypothetical protein AALP_AA4G256800 [Arabis alpina]|uniref:Uncharacterized protein n=1 Tax=Arabis alpina TaxID=50452 RepID=A0A087H5N4_ARAAL|nr:hypothetical protein AALP_AA4G256800 [Arabis alpina]